MIPAFQKDESFLEDVRRRRTGTGLHLWWLGQSGFLVQWKGRHLLIDPYLSDSLTRKYAGTNRPHVRMSERVIDPALLDFIDVVTSSHPHTDHLDPDTLIPLLKANPALDLIVPESGRRLAAERLEIDDSRLTGLDHGQSVEIGAFRFHGIAAAHESLETDEQGHHRYLGYVVKCGPWTLYHSGDTLRYPGMARCLRGWPIDLAMLPINGRAPERGVAGNLTGPEAARLGRDMGAGLVIPCHFEMFEFNTAPPDAFAEEARRLGQPFQILRCGELWSGRK